MIENKESICKHISLIHIYMKLKTVEFPTLLLLNR